MWFIETIIEKIILDPLSGIFYRKASGFRFVRKFKLFHSGVQGYYYSFRPEDNLKVWMGIQKELCYVGISATSIINELLDFMNTEKGRKIEYRFLLMDPGSTEFIKKQEMYKKGYKQSERLSADKVKELNKEVENTKTNIKLCIERIKNTENFRRGAVQIKIYHEFIPWWKYLIDDDKICVGILEFGKSGRYSPLVILEKNKKNYFTLYDAFKNNWQRIWDSAIEVT